MNMSSCSSFIFYIPPQLDWIPFTNTVAVSFNHSSTVALLKTLPSSEKPYNMSFKFALTHAPTQRQVATAVRRRKRANKSDFLILLRSWARITPERVIISSNRSSRGAQPRRSTWRLLSPVRSYILLDMTRRWLLLPDAKVIKEQNVRRHHYW